MSDTFPKAWQNQKDAREYVPRNLSDYSLIGFKVMYGQLKYNKGLLRYIKRNDVKVIHLYRKNVLALLVSRELKKITGIAHSTRKEDVITNQQVFLEPSTILQNLKPTQSSVEKWHSAFMKKNSLIISFEDFLADQCTRESVLDFLT